jgi:hypothetical protein
MRPVGPALCLWEIVFAPHPHPEEDQLIDGPEMSLPQFVADYALSLRVDIDAHSTPLRLYKDRGFCLESQAHDPVSVVAIRNGEFDRDSDASGLIRPSGATSAQYRISVGYFVCRAVTHHRNLPSL